MAIFEGHVITGPALTITVAVMGVPLQPLATGVMVKVTVTVAPVVFVSEPVIFPLPDAAMPVAATRLSLVQLKTVPPTPPENEIVEIGSPEQMVCEAGLATALGMGFTVPLTARFWEAGAET